MTSSGSLPKLKEVFGELRRGRHICAEDGELFRALQEHYADYVDLFGQLGFRFERHPRDFFYFCGEDALTDAARRLSVFMFVLVEWLGDEGESVGDALGTQTFGLARLPHLTQARYAGYMGEVGVEDPLGLERVVVQLERLGFAQRLRSGEFRFRAPVSRFLDLCEEFAAEDDA